MWVPKTGTRFFVTSVLSLVAMGAFGTKLLKNSLMVDWIATIYLCLHDEAQQFGNLDEVAALARLPHTFVSGQETKSRFQED